VVHNSPKHIKCQTQTSKVLTLPQEQAHQDGYNYTPQPMREFQVMLKKGYLWNYLDNLVWIGIRHIYWRVVGCSFNTDKVEHGFPHLSKF